MTRIDACSSAVESHYNKMWHSVVLSHIHLLIILTDLLIPQQTEHFCLYCPDIMEGTIYTYII